MGGLRLSDKKPRRNPNDRPLRSEKKVSLAPLSFEGALKGLLQAGPHPQDDETEPTEDKEKTPPKGRRSSKMTDD